MELVLGTKIHSMHLSNDLRKIIIKLINNILEIWSIENLSKIKTFSNFESATNNFILTSDSKYLIYSNKNNEIVIWDYLLNRAILNIRGHRNEITTIRVSPDNSKIISASEDNTIKVWDFLGKQLLSIQANYGGISDILIDSNLKSIINSSADYEIKFWDINSGKFLYKLEEHEYSINNIKLSRSGTILISNSKEKLLIWDLKKKKVLNNFNTFDKPLNILAISNDEEYVVGASNESILCYKIRSSKIESKQYLDKECCFLGFNENGKYLILGLKPNIIKRYEFLKWIDENRYSSNNLGVLEIPFRAYTGTEPYIFISYAHLDKEFVYEEMNYIRNNNFNIWYDEGIPPSTEWPLEIETAIKNCSAFIIFITPRAIERINVRNEINYALNKDIPVLAIFLEPTELKYGLELRLGSKQAIMKYNFSNDLYHEKLVEALRNFI